MFKSILSVFLLLSLVSCSGHLPSISDPDRLVADCTGLMALAPNESVPANQWPDSVKALSPIAVRQEPGYVMITTYAQTGDAARGYVVTSGAAPHIDHENLSATANPHIFCFEYYP